MPLHLCRRNVWIACLAFAWAVAARADTETKQFDIEAGKAIETLKTAAFQADVEILISVAVSSDIRTKRIHGEFTAEEALNQILEGTPLVAVPVSAGKAFGIVSRDKAAANRQRASTSQSEQDTEPTSEMNRQHSLKKKTFATAVKSFLALALAGSAEAQTEEPAESVYTLSPFEVSASSENSLWSVNQSSGGTRVAVPVKELPFSLDVLTTDFMDDFVLSDVSEALPHIGNVSGMEPHTGAGSGNSIRGFTQYFQLRNGFYRNGVVGKTLIDRVEVIKGPYAAIYGRSEPGGVINYISKKPIIGQSSGKLSMIYGENETQRVQLEKNVPLGKSTALLLAGSYFERDFDQMYTHERSVNYGAALTHTFSERTGITFEYEHMFRRNNRGRPVTDIRIDGTDPTDGTRNKYTGEFAWDFIDQYGWVNTLGPTTYSDRLLDTVNVTLTHRFADNVNFRIAYNDSQTEQNYDYTAFGSSTILVDPVTKEFTRWATVPAPFYRQLPTDVTALQADLTIDFKTGNIKHSTLITFDYTQQEDGRVSERAARGRATDVLTVDYPDGVPNYANDAGALHGPRTDVYMDYDTTINYEDTPQYYTWLQENRELKYDIHGLFLMHRVRLMDGKLLLMAGGRYDEAKTTITDRLSPDKKTITGVSESKVDDFTYNVGINYNITPRTVLYGSHSTSFNPKGDVYSNTGEPMPNESGSGYEVGVRTTALEDRIDMGVSYFSIERQNIKIRNPDFDINEDDASEKPEYVAGGLDRAEGFELFANGKLTDSLSLRASVGTVNARHVVSIEDWMEGLHLTRVPDWNYSVGANYRVRKGSLKGLSLNASYRAQSDYPLQERTPTPTDLRNNLRSEEGGFLDLAFGYGWKSSEDLRHSLRLAIKNVFDERIIYGSGYFSDGRQIDASYTLTF